MEIFAVVYHVFPDLVLDFGDLGLIYFESLQVIMLLFSDFFIPLLLLIINKQDAFQVLFLPHRVGIIIKLPVRGLIFLNFHLKFDRTLLLFLFFLVFIVLLLNPVYLEFRLFPLTYLELLVLRIVRFSHFVCFLEDYWE